MTLREHQSAFLKDVCKLIEFAFESGFQVSGGELWRSPEQQAIYVKSGRSKTMDSKHLKRCAIDLNIFRGDVLCTSKEITPLGDYWESLNPINRWGGRFSKLVDGPHFERNV